MSGREVGFFLMGMWLGHFLGMIASAIDRERARRRGET